MRERLLHIGLDEAVKRFSGRRWKFYEVKPKLIILDVLSGNESLIVEIPFTSNEQLSSIEKKLVEAQFMKESVRENNKNIVYARILVNNSPCLMDFLGKHLYHHRFKGWFKGAGKTYNWGSHHNDAGIGLSDDLLKVATDNELDIRVFLGNDDHRVWQIDPSEAKDFALRHNSFYKAEAGFNLNIVSVDCFSIVISNELTQMFKLLRR